ncbi:efflux RND transporter periplasmic adaptor subunit [Maridesulfovibrio sp.]|uniref:efflux RND transporter periplasmic adaptor subunit n=1 Tax=Maridesulfovibrio sp. TaxID=2795000 RepID=UPI003AFFE73C
MQNKSLFKKLLFIPAIAVGIIILIFMVKSKTPPQESGLGEQAKAVRVIKAPELSVRPKAKGYGFVKPGQEWEAVAEVPGRIVYFNKKLRKGAIIGRDEILLKIDPAQRLTAEKQAEADVQNLLAQLQELEQREVNVKRQLAVENKSLNISKIELERRQQLVKNGVISRSELDQEEKIYLAQKNAVHNYRNTLNIIPAERQALLAKVTSARSRLDDARYDIEKTIIRAPYDCRISALEVELNEAVKSGQVLVTADSMGVSETLAQIPLYAMINVVPMPEEDISFLGEERTYDIDRVIQRMGLTAVVRLQTAYGPVEWNARVARISERIDPKTRSVGVYVAVDNPYIKSRGSKRPPLIRDMYAQVELRGRPRPPAVVIPRAALHEDRVYVVNAENRLEIRKVSSGYTTGRLATITEGLKAGETVIVSDLVPAIGGMLIDPVADPEALATLKGEAEGERSAQ